MGLDVSTVVVRRAATLLVGALALGLVGMALGEPPSPELEVVETPTVEPVEEAPRFTDVRHLIARGETLGAILPRFGISDVMGVVEVASPYHDLTRIRAGRELVFRYEVGHEAPVELRYAIDEDRTLVVFTQPLRAELEEQAYESRLGVRTLELNGSLWNEALDAGLRPNDIARLGAVFQWEVDFNTELRAGARFTLVAEELWQEGAFVKLGELFAVRLENGSKDLAAIAYTVDGELGWYHPDGTAAKRPFLRSPLSFSRVTSGFNPKRYHPVLKTRRPHNGTDFGAPSGTPVRATGDATVSFAGRNGGHGRHIKLDHSGPYETTYSHLSKLAVKEGQRVSQGDVIGYVGSTGMSTGPHLHYEFHVSGKAVDAMNVDLPNTEPMPSGELAAFEEHRDEWLPRLGLQAGGDAVVSLEP